MCVGGGGGRGPDPLTPPPPSARSCPDSHINTSSLAETLSPTAKAGLPCGRFKNTSSDRRHCLALTAKPLWVGLRDVFVYCK